MNNTNVKITIQGTQHDISEETTEATYSGCYRFLSGKHIITYDEYFEEEGTLPSKNTNLIKIDSDSIQITKKGTVTTQMYFENGKKHFGTYQTPFGTFDMMLYTNQLTLQKTEQIISATINYELSLNNCPVSKCTIHIYISES